MIYFTILSLKRKINTYHYKETAARIRSSRHYERRGSRVSEINSDRRSTALSLSHLLSSAHDTQHHDHCCGSSAGKCGCLSMHTHANIAQVPVLRV